VQEKSVCAHACQARHLCQLSPRNVSRSGRFVPPSRRIYQADRPFFARFWPFLGRRPERKHRPQPRLAPRRRRSSFFPRRRPPRPKPWPGWPLPRSWWAFSWPRRPVPWSGWPFPRPARRPSWPEPRRPQRALPR